MIVRLASVLVLSLVLGPVLRAQGPAVPPKPRAAATNDAARGAAMRAALLAKTGGFVTAPASGPALLLLDTRKGAAEKLTASAAANLQQLLRLPVKSLVRAGADPLAEAARLLADTNTAAAVIVVTELPGQPTLLIAPESRWAQVNAAALATAGVPASLLDERLHKELLRALGYLMGAGHSSSGRCLMRAVRSTAELDVLEAKNLSLEPLGKIMTHARFLGMQPIRMAPYRKAVEEGWAAAPTNDAQKAIWNEVKQRAP